MITVNICNEIEQARCLWEENWPQRGLFDLWEARACFQEHFSREPCFLTVLRDGRLEGLLALSWIGEKGCFGHFPGETWKGRTWLEQNRILARSADVFQLLWDAIPGEAEIRYLTPESDPRGRFHARIDEIGWLFYPAQYDYSFTNYMQGLPGKTRKKIRAELKRLEAQGVSHRFDHMPDLERLFMLNLESFGTRSYFGDARFLRSFERLAAWLHDNHMLRITTVLIGGEVAAVDMGAIWCDTYTLLAGGTHPGFPGVAKLINMHHLEWSCRRRFASVDFLCGDFNWKARFRLTPRSLHLMNKEQPILHRSPAWPHWEAAHAN